MKGRTFIYAGLSLVLTSLLTTGCFQSISPTIVVSEGAAPTAIATSISTMTISPSVTTANGAFMLPSPVSTCIPIDQSTLELREYALNLTAQDLNNEDRFVPVYGVAYSSGWQSSSISTPDETAAKETKQVLNDWGYHCEDNYLYKDDQLLVQSLYCDEGDASFNHSGTDFVWFLPVHSKAEGSIVSRNNEQYWRQQDHFWVLPRYVGDELLTVQLYSFEDWYEVRAEMGGQTVYTETLTYPDVGDCLGAGIQVWDDQHWGLNTQEDVIIDGERVTRKQGYTEAYGLHVLAGKPIYFAAKDHGIEMNFAGHIVPLRYDQVIHPCYPVYQEVIYPVDIRTHAHLLWFFALKDNQLYYIQMELQE